MIRGIRPADAVDPRLRKVRRGAAEGDEGHSLAGEDARSLVLRRRVRQDESVDDAGGRRTSEVLPAPPWCVTTTARYRCSFATATSARRKVIVNGLTMPSSAARE